MEVEPDVPLVSPLACALEDVLGVAHMALLEGTLVSPPTPVSPWAMMTMTFKCQQAEDQMNFFSSYGKILVL